LFVFGVIPHKATSLKQLQKLPGHLLFYMGSNAGSISPLTADATCYTVFIMRACTKAPTRASNSFITAVQNLKKKGCLHGKTLSDCFTFSL